MTSATTTRITRAVFLSKPLVAAGDGVTVGAVLKLMVVTTGGISDV